MKHVILIIKINQVIHHFVYISHLTKYQNTMKNIFWKNVLVLTWGISSTLVKNETRSNLLVEHGGRIWIETHTVSNTYQFEIVAFIQLLKQLIIVNL